MILKLTRERYESMVALRKQGTSIRAIAEKSRCVKERRSQMVEYLCRRKRAFDEEKSNKTKEQITGVDAPEYPSVASPEDEEEGS